MIMKRYLETLYQKKNECLNYFLNFSLSGKNLKDQLNLIQSESYQFVSLQTHSCP